MLDMSAMKPNKNRNCCLPNREWGVNVKFHLGVPGYLSHVDGQTYFLSGFWELLLVFLLSSWHIYVSANWQTLSLFRLPPPRSCFLVTTALCSYPLQFLEFKSCLI